MKELIDFSKIIKDLRIRYKYTQKQVSDHLGITYQSYQAYELGLSMPNLQNFVKLAKFYDVSLDYLVGNSHF